jgi:nitroreductase
MDFQTLLKKRRAIRDFHEQEVPLSVIKEIIQDTSLAPTASNLQPCKFVIIQNKDYIKRLSDESKKNFLADVAEDPDSSMKKYEDYFRDKTFNAFYNAPCLVYIIGPKNLWSLDVDCTMTAAYFMFSATSRGLGTCWIAMGTNIRDRDMLHEMGITEDCRIVAPLIVGYPSNLPSPLPRHAPDILKII